MGAGQNHRRSKRRLVGLPHRGGLFPDRQHLPVPAALPKGNPRFGNGERTLNVLPAARPLRTIAGEGIFVDFLFILQIVDLCYPAT